VVLNKLSMQIGLVTGNSEQVRQGTETTSACVITYQMTSTKKDIIWHEEKNKYPNDQKNRHTKSVSMIIRAHQLISSNSNDDKNAREKLHCPVQGWPEGDSHHVTAADRASCL
jgi:hypothetical protein